MFLTECPRDAMQGWHQFIPTRQKIEYLNLLMQVGFDVLDCGSFVSPKAIPQMKDTAEVLDNVDKSISNTQLSVIVANISGAAKAIEHQAVDILGFPFSISETFQYRNTNKNQEEAFEQVQQILEMTQSANKQLRVYFSMAFGNPYGEMWKWEDVYSWAKKFNEIGVKKILLSDTIGVAIPETISLLFSKVPKDFPAIEFGAHFHTKYEDASIKLKTAYQEGCRSFDGTIRGIGGCPMAKEDLVGNMPTEKMINLIMKEKTPHRLNLLHFERAYNEAKDLFQF